MITPEELSLTHKMTLLALQVGLILFAAKLGSILAQKIKLPGVIGELISGIVIGPWALGGIGFGDGLFKYGIFRGQELRIITEAGGNPFAVSPELYGICTLASVILLFISGVETNLKMFLKFAVAGSIVGVGGVIVSFVLGDLSAAYFLPMFLDKYAYLGQLPFVDKVMSPQALFMGIMSTATSVGITARILSERRKMDSAEGVTIMAGAVIDDVLGIIVLAIGMGIITAGGGDGVGDIKVTQVAIKAFAVWIVGTAIGLVLARQISWVLKLFKSHVAIATLAFGLSLVIAGLFESMGLSLIIGAYVMGLALSRTDLKYMIQENLQSAYTFLVPVFFCVMGMMVDCRAFCSKPVVIFGAIYTIWAILAKLIGCAMPSLLCGFNMRGALRVGAGMIPRGEVALIIAGIGVSTFIGDKPILSQEIFGVGIIMTLVTTLIAPPMLITFFASPKSGVRDNGKNLAVADSRPFSFELSSDEVAVLVMDRLITTFREDGFFTFLMNIDEHIWSVTMDNIEIVVRREGRKICFECSQLHESLVMSAWLEVVGQINSIAKSISSPIRHDDLEYILKQESKCKKAGSIFDRLICDFVMIPKFRANSKSELLAHLVESIAKAKPYSVQDIEKAKSDVMVREEAMSTGLDLGIALPHARTTAVSHVVGAVALLEDGSVPDYETFDKSPVKICVLSLVPESGQQPHLHMMASITRLLHAQDGYKRLLECKTEEKMRNFFKN